MCLRTLPRLLLALALALALAPIPAASADDLRADADAGKALLAEGDARADRGETTEAVLRYKRAFEQLLPGLRGLPFRREVKRDVTARDDLRKVIVKELDEEQSPGEFRGDELGMKALGLIPRDLDLKKTLVELYTEQIAAFYDPKTGTMHLIKEPEGPKAPKPSLLERLLGKKGGFDKDENKTTIAHELTHALTDQHFNLDALQRRTKGDDDRQLALSALVEGDATLAMLGAQMQDWKGQKVAALPAADLDRVFRLLGPLMVMSGGPRLNEAPPILGETLVFPYLRGLTFCARLTNDGGWESVNAAYRSPPLSTEQVLHPDKYRAHPDAPTTVDLPKLDAGEGWKEVGRNVVGELQTSVLLRKHDGQAAAAGWDGDAYAAFEGPDGRLGLVWATTWDTDSDAREFARSYARFQTTKLGPDVPEPDAFPDAIRRPHAGSVFAVERRGPDVVVVEGFPAASTESLLEDAFRARKSEKTHAPAPRAKVAWNFGPRQGDLGKLPAFKDRRPGEPAPPDPKTQAIPDELEQSVATPHGNPQSLENIVTSMKITNADPKMSGGVPISISSDAPMEVGVTMDAGVVLPPKAGSLEGRLADRLKSRDAAFLVKDGLLTIATRSDVVGPR